jgi:hypothetical protein
MSTDESRDLTATFVWSLALLLVALFADAGSVGAILRTVIAAPLVLVLTGHVVLRAIGFVPDSLLTYLAYVIGVSIATCVGGGFVLNLLSLLTPFGWAIWYVGVTGIALRVGVHRQNDVAVMLSAVSFPRLQQSHVIVVGLAVLVTIGTYRIALHDEAADREFKYTEFWMVPKAGIEIIGIKNAETETQTFTIEVTGDDQMIAVWRSITVKPNETWTHGLPISPDLHDVEAKLYNQQGLYRTVSRISTVEARN